MVVLLLHLLADAGRHQIPVEEVVLDDLRRNRSPTKLIMVAFLIAVAWQSMQVWPFISEK